MNNEQLYPKLIPEEEIKSLIDQKLKKSDEVRLNFIKEFIDELEIDYKKYQYAKQKYATVKNILVGFDIISGGVLTLTGIILEVFSLGSSTVVSLVLSGVGIELISTLPLSHKLTDKLTCKTRNFQTSAGNKLNKVKLIFSKAIEDESTTHEEYESIVEVKKESR